MGGSIFVGVRARDGVEHLGISWTNWLPRLFADPTFYEEGDAFRELMDYWNNEEGRGERRKRIAPSEYGAVLVDLATASGERPQMWTCNGYSSFGNYLYSIGATNEPRCDELAARLLDRKQYAAIRWDYFKHFDDAGDPTPEQLAQFRDAIARCLRGEPYRRGPLLATSGSFPTIVIETVGALIDCERVAEDDRAKAKKMNAWLARRGWKSPSATTWRRS